MPCIFAAVSRLLQGTKHNGADDAFFPGSMNFFQQILKALGMDLFSAPLQMISEVMDQFIEFLQLLRRGIFMNPVQKRDFIPRHILRHGFIADQHELFNDPVGYAAFIGPDINGFSFLIQYDFCFIQVKINAAPAHSFLPKDPAQDFHIAEVVDQGTISFHQFRIIFFQYFGYILVDHSFRGTDHAFFNPMVHHFSPMIDFHEH